MITIYGVEAGRLVALPGPDDGTQAPAAGPAPVWIDMLFPTEDEERFVEALLGIGIPTREDMQEIEISSRLYQEDGALFLTALVMASVPGGLAENEPVTFVLTRNILVTIRYHSPRSFGVFVDLAGRQSMGLTGGGAVFTALLEVVIDRLADILEGERLRLDSLTGMIFRIGSDDTPRKRAADLTEMLDRIGLAEDMNGKVAESLRSIERVLGFAVAPNPGTGGTLQKVDLARVKTMRQDLKSLGEYAETQAQKVRFLLDSSLGLINIRQSEIIKVFSVVAFVFLPPTLIASIYGMNFDVMPELRWQWGYPAALLAMVVSAVLPYLFFKLKGWIK